jgi:hypothetical protein
MYTSLCIARVIDDHRSCQKLINYITNIKAKSKRLRKIGINFHQYKNKHLILCGMGLIGKRGKYFADK